MTVKTRIALVAVAIAIVAAVGAGALLTNGRAADPTDTVVSAPAPRAFPDVDRTALSPLQTRVLDVLRAQYDAQPPGSTYSEGVEEPWCADFISWVMREVGAPLDNPNSGSWRIPGVYTLQEYYQATGRFELPEYLPAPGDVVLYDDGSAFGLHANVVVARDGTTVTTVGGNEPGGGIRVSEHALDADAHLLGFGRLA